MEPAQALDKRLTSSSGKKSIGSAWNIEAKTVPPTASEISAAHRAEGRVLAISEFAHLLAQFRNRRRAVPRCPIATGDQIERHRSSTLNLSRLARLRSASQSCSRERPGFPFTGISPIPPSGATVQPGNMLAIHSAVARSMTITVLGFVSSGFRGRDTHDCLIHRLPVTRSLHLPGVEAKRVEEREVCWRRIECGQDHRMMEVLVTSSVQTASLAAAGRAP